MYARCFCTIVKQTIRSPKLNKPGAVCKYLLSTTNIRIMVLGLGEGSNSILRRSHCGDLNDMVSSMFCEDMTGEEPKRKEEEQLGGSVAVQLQNCGCDLGGWQWRWKEAESLTEGKEERSS